MEKVVVSDFSQTPAGRYESDGDVCGEIFRNTILIPAIKDLKEGQKLHVVIDNVEGYGSSFLEEAFGGVVRDGAKSAEDFLRLLVIEYSDEYFEVYERKIKEYIRDASQV